MQHNVEFTFQEWTIPARCRKPRWVPVVMCETVDIREIRNPAPLAIEIRDERTGEMRPIRCHEGRFYCPAGSIDIRACRYMAKLDPLEHHKSYLEQSEAYRNAGISNLSPDPEAEIRAELREQAGRHLLMDGAPWIEVDEPVIEYWHHSSLSYECHELRLVEHHEFLRGHYRQTWRLDQHADARRFLASQVRAHRARYSRHHRLLVRDEAIHGYRLHDADVLAYDAARQHPNAEEQRQEEAKQKFAPETVLAMLHRFFEGGDFDVWRYGGTQSAIEQCLSLHFDRTPQQVLEALDN